MSARPIRLLVSTPFSVHYLLFYDFVDDYAARRVPLRVAHFAHAKRAIAAGELVLGGALANPPDGAGLLFQGASPPLAEKIAAADPYVTHGLVTNLRGGVRGPRAGGGGGPP